MDGPHPRGGTGGTTRFGADPAMCRPHTEHGPLDRAPHALRTPAAENRVAALDMGILPCDGVYFEVVTEGTIRIGDGVVRQLH